jgi:peptidoglycan-N-acetylglucosamine deacetylase
MKGKIKIITSWDDFCDENYRIADLLKKYNLPGIFFIPTETDPSSREMIENLADKGFEIGCHTKTHPRDLKALDFDGLAFEISDCRKQLQEIANQEIEWFCYPRGRYNEITKKYVLGAGFKYARTTKVLNISEAKDNSEIKTAIHVGYQRDEYEKKDWLIMAFELFDKALKKENSVFHLWGHGWEIAKFNQWEKLEKLLSYISKKINEKT